MANSETFRCYYDDGTIITNAAECPLANDNGSPLIASDLTIVDDVTEKIGFPWLLLVLAMVILASKERG